MILRPREDWYQLRQIRYLFLDQDILQMDSTIEDRFNISSKIGISASCSTGTNPRSREHRLKITIVIRISSELVAYSI